MIWSSDTKSTGKLREGPPFRGPPHTPAAPASPVNSYCSKCTNEVRLYVVYVIVFWYVKNDRRSPFSHLCLIFYFLFYAIEQQQQTRQEGGGGGGGPPWLAHGPFRHAERAIQRTPPPPTPTPPTPSICSPYSNCTSWFQVLCHIPNC